MKLAASTNCAMRPREQFEVSGPVFGLVRYPYKAKGDVTVRVQVDEEPRSVWMRLRVWLHSRCFRIEMHEAQSPH